MPDLPIEVALKGLLDSEGKLRTQAGVNDPQFMSEQMMRLAQYTGAVEEHLAILEQDFETELTMSIRKYLKQGKSATAADRLARTDHGAQKGNILYLSRLVSSAWKQVSIVQSRYNHISKGIAGQT